MTKKFDLSPEEQLALARATIDKLETQRQETIERRSEILGEERELTYHALGAGDAQAKEKLTKLESENTTLARQVDHLDSAIEIGRERLIEAELAVTAKANKEKAVRIRAYAATLKRAGQDLDDACAEAARKFQAVESALQQLRAIGVAHPSHDLVTVNLKRALMAALRALPLKLDVVAVGERYSFASLTEGWSKGAERAASVLAADSPASNKAA